MPSISSFGFPTGEVAHFLSRASSGIFSCDFMLCTVTHVLVSPLFLSLLAFNPQCDKEIEQVQSQLEEYKDPPLSLSRLSLKQQKFRTFRETANELHSETLSVLSDLEGWCELNWAGLSNIQIRLPLVREKLRDMSHCLSDCWTTLDNTQRLLSTLTEATQWCDAVSSTPSSPTTSSSTCPLASLPPIPPSRFQDARSLALELGGGALLDLWTQTVERYQRTVAQVKPRLLHSERTQNQSQGKPKMPSGSNFWDLPTEAPLPAKPPRKRHPSFDLQALLAPRKGAATPKPESPVGGASRNSPMSWLGRKNLADPVIATSMAAAMPGMLSSERQYVAVLKGVEETYLPLLELSDTPASIRGKGESLFPNWGSLSAFHSQNLLPAMEGALVQSLLQQDCFSKYLCSQTDHHQVAASTHDVTTCHSYSSLHTWQIMGTGRSMVMVMTAPIQRLEQYCEALEELGGLNLASDSALSVLRHAQRHGEDLRASDLIVGCPVRAPVPLYMSATVKSHFLFLDGKT
ncbi:hypothetical protein GOODEAATRI_017317 [Goodea atripinnis]|uniref:DH domain-containing protein n=1 Tax=Goodea atripinnis TaxID=208336 RepID=A0ABV0N290_9TELE